MIYDETTTQIRGTEAPVGKLRPVERGKSLPARVSRVGFAILIGLVGAVSCASDTPDTVPSSQEPSSAPARPQAPDRKSRPGSADRQVGAREIGIDFATRGQDPKRSMFGLNHGLLVKKPVAGLLDPLPITYYRSGKNLWRGVADRMLRHSPETVVHVFMLPASYEWWDHRRHGQSRKPYDPHSTGSYDWTSYDGYLNAFLSDFASRPQWVSALREGRMILGPWNEAINNNGDFGDNARHQYFTGTEEQFYATFKRAHDAVRARFPEAKICGPSYGTDFSFGPALDRFMEWAREAKIQLDALCLHAIADTPNRYPDFEQGVKDYRKKYIDSAEWRSLGVKEIHVDENLHDRNARNPATILGMLTWLERSGADYGTKNSGKDYGWNGSLSGLLNDRGQPVAGYWVPRRYGEMLTGRRTFRAPVPSVTGIVSIGSDGVGRAMFGHYAQEATQKTRSVPVRITGLSEIGKPPYKITLEGSIYDSDGGEPHMKPKLFWQRATSDSTFVFQHDVTTHDVTYVTIEAAR